MKSISIYTITRNQTLDNLQRLERQLSGRGYFLRMREWEMESMKALTEHLEVHIPQICSLRFFYSFQIPKLGKEFDLLQIKKDQIVNIELKSGVVSDEAICKQLLQNRYYLSVLGKPLHSYTYISNQNRLVKLTKHDHIIEADWEHLCTILQKESPDYEGDIEDLFQAELYLISPLTEPARFLRKEYFLTSQQRDIERQILKKIRTEHTGYYWFNGLPGTGKTLLLYDIAMKLSVRQRICMIHCGETARDWEILHERLQRIDFLTDKELANEREPVSFDSYSAILVDEAHLLSAPKLDILLNAVNHQPVIFSSDSEDMISPEEMDQTTIQKIERLPQILTFHLTNRIRTNAELSSFIQNMLHLPRKKSSRYYPHIEVVCANNESETQNLLDGYIHQGYQYRQTSTPADLNTAAVRVTDRLVTVLDERYYYDTEGYLRSSLRNNSGSSDVRTLFHLLNQTKENLSLIIEKNESVYEILLEILQMHRK